jgi:aspartate aminotransferase-like enzyme
VANLLGRVRGRLCAATGAQDVQVLSGTGTLANDAIAAQLAARPGRGLVLVNGEFGERLAAHAAGARAVADVLRLDWDRAFDFEAIAASRAAQPPAWAWMVHCETSTGRMNDADAFRAMCRRLGCIAALDCVSSLGNVPVSTDGIAFASGVSGKGLAGLTGLALVFHRSDALLPAGYPGIPRCLDLDHYRSTGGVAWSLSSNLLEALDRALSEAGWPAVPGSVAQRPVFRTQALRQAVVAVLAAGGLRVLVQDAGAAPFLVTVPLPRSVDSAAVGEAMQREGFAIAWESAYLRTRNWVQLAWMGRRPDAEVLAAARALLRCCRHRAAVAGTGRVARSLAA